MEKLYKNIKSYSSRSYPAAERNNLFASFHQFRKCVRDAVSQRKQTLCEQLNSDKFKKMALKGKGSVSRYQTIHVESGLVERLKKCGLAKYIVPLKQPKPVDFDKFLQQAETEMSTEAEFGGNVKQLANAALAVRDACNFPTERFVPSSVDDAANFQINKSSSSSYPDYKRKGQVLDELKINAEAVFKGFRDPFSYPITRGFRIQLRPNKETGVEMKLRVMYPYPGVIILVEDCFIMPFVNHFINNDTFYVIGKTGQQIGRLLKRKFNVRKIKRISSTDIKSFDQTAVNDAVISAFWILRSQLRLDSEQHDVFVNLVAYFCVTWGISKSSDTGIYNILKVKGVPSGSGFTNMIDSLVNAIAFEYTLPGILKQGRTLICGDDNIFDSSNVDFDYMVKSFKENFNFTISIEKTQHFKDSRKLHFLGFDWIQYERFQDITLLINQLVWHSSFMTELDKYERELARGASVLLNAKNGQNLFKLVFPDVVDLLDSGLDVRYWYLHGTQPPSALPSVASYAKTGVLKMAGTTQSLRNHFYNGWNIR